MSSIVRRVDVSALIASLNGGVFGCTFISRKDGTERRSTYTTNVRKYGRTGQGLNYDPTTKQLVQVCDLVVARARARGVTNDKGSLVGDDRMIPLEGILSIRANGVEYIVTN
jgi:hypothetical protein